MARSLVAWDTDLEDPISLMPITELHQLDGSDITPKASVTGFIVGVFKLTDENDIVSRYEDQSMVDELFMLDGNGDIVSR